MLGHFKHEGIGVRWSMEAENEDWIVKTYVGVYHVAERCRTRPNLNRAVDIAKGLAPVLLDRVRGDAA
jgi:hypothetical protein